MDGFGEILKRHRTARGLTLRQLAQLVHLDHSYISQVERGKRPSRKFAEACDRVLEAGGALTLTFDLQAGDNDMRRRTIFQVLGAALAAPAVGSLAELEGLRHGLGAAMDVDEWDQIVTDYGLAYYRTPAEVLAEQLRHDFELLGLHLAAADGTRRLGLLRAAGRLSVIVALSFVASGQTILANRWWRSAAQAADGSGDADTRVLVRAWDVVNGCYDGRSPDAVVDLSEQVLPLLHGQATAATCGLLAGRAQALSLAGRHTEAVATVQQLTDVAEQLPAAVTGDVESLWGWPELRVLHTQSWVLTHAGRHAEAEAAQDRALAMYPRSQARLRSQVQLHRAAGLIHGGHIPDGLRLAADVLDELPPAQHNQLLRAVAQHVVDAVPAAERRRPVYRELTDRVSA